MGCALSKLFSDLLCPSMRKKSDHTSQWKDYDYIIVGGGTFLRSNEWHVAFIHHRHFGLCACFAIIRESRLYCSTRGIRPKVTPVCEISVTKMMTSWAEKARYCHSLHLHGQKTSRHLLTGNIIPRVSQKTFLHHTHLRDNPCSSPNLNDGHRYHMARGKVLGGTRSVRNTLLQHAPLANASKIVLLMQRYTIGALPKTTISGNVLNALDGPSKK